jgi:hypothetical protein
VNGFGGAIGATSPPYPLFPLESVLVGSCATAWVSPPGNLEVPALQPSSTSTDINRKSPGGIPLAREWHE